MAHSASELSRGVCGSLWGTYGLCIGLMVLALQYNFWEDWTAVPNVAEACAAQCCPVCRAAAIPGPLGGLDAFTRDGLSTSVAQLDTVLREVS